MALFTGKDVKTCSGCTSVKSVDDFSKDKTKFDGLCTNCKVCKKRQKTRWDASQRRHQERTANRILCFGDDQAPAQHPDAYEILKDAKHKFNPTRVVHMGDELDLNNVSDYLKSVDADNAQTELGKGLDHLKKLYQLFPNVDVLRSNHVDARIQRKKDSAGVPQFMLRSIEEMLEMPKGWKRHDEIIIDDILFRHGHKDRKNLKGTLNRLVLHRHKKYYNMLCGHHHTAFGFSHLPELVAENGRMKFLWGGHSGCLMDRNHPYAKAYSAGYEILGFTVIENGLPRFIIPETDDDNRWTGVLYDAYGGHEI
jgi:hypothetical protein